jgi:hypothetical protein
MKLESKTIQILKNFSSINPSLMFKPGEVLSTVSPQKTVMAKATIGNQIPSSFAIYDLSKFLGVLSLFESPELIIGERSMEISGGQQKVNYTFADPKLIVTPNDKEVKMPECEIKFRLTSDDLSKVLKAMGVLQLPEIAITGNGTDMNIEAIDSKNPSSDTYKVRLGDTELNFKMIFKAENIKIMSGDYDVQISSKGIAHFKGTEIEYWIATEASSTFNQ